MATIESMLASWIPGVLDKYLNEDWNPQNQGFGAQCWDVSANWSKFLGLPVINTGGKGRWPGWAGNMADAFPQSPAIAAAYEKLPPSATVLGGDILVWDDSYFWYPKTHVAVGVRDLGAQVLCVSQNSSASRVGNPYPQWTTGPTILQHLPRKGLLAIIRPKTGLQAQGTIKTGELTMAEIDDINSKLATLLERTDPINTSSGKVSIRQFIADGTRAAQAAEDQTSAINTARGQVSLKQFVADGTRASQSVAAKVAGLEAALKAVLNANGNTIDLDAVTAAAERGASQALSKLEGSITFETGNK